MKDASKWNQWISFGRQMESQVVRGFLPTNLEKMLVKKS